jgi:hypothetical protein
MANASRTSRQKNSIWEEPVKQLLSALSLLLAVAACAPPEPPPPAAPGPPGNAAAPSGYTSTYYDGTYTGQLVQNVSGVTTGQCPKFNVAPALTIKNGVARFAALDLTFQGYVTSQGGVTMQSAGGQTFYGQIDPYFQLRGRVIGNCVYDATWQRYQKRP